MFNSIFPQIKKLLYMMLQLKKNDSQIKLIYFVRKNRKQCCNINVHISFQIKTKSIKKSALVDLSDVEMPAVVHVHGGTDKSCINISFARRLFTSKTTDLLSIASS